MKTVGQLEREVIELRKLVKELMQPKSKARVVNVGQNDILIKTPGGGIAAASGTGPYTFGSATCTIVGSDGVVGSDTVTVKNIVNDAVAANVIGKASMVGGIWVIDVASCS